MSGVSTPRRVVLLGSTGSVGTQTLDIARQAPERVAVTAIAAGGSNPASITALAAQAAEFDVEAVGLAREEFRGDLLDALQAHYVGRPLPEVVTGPGAVVELAARDTDTVLNAVAGSLGLRATLSALATGATVALANKESLVAGGPLVTPRPRSRVSWCRSTPSTRRSPSACAPGTAAEVARLVVTASGGPFRGRTRDELRDVTPAQALDHPTWDMGKLITTNSATLVNKALEVIEARLLFDIDYDRIDVVVHPQSVVHSMVTFVDGATIAQASPPDMRLPIALALGWPDRDRRGGRRRWTGPRAASGPSNRSTRPRSPPSRSARRAGRVGGCAPAVFNAANEELVEAFHAGRLPFLGIVDTIGEVVERWLSEHQAGAGTRVRSRTSNRRSSGRASPPVSCHAEPACRAASPTSHEG